MKYINVKSVKQKIREGNKQISKEALFALDVKIDEFLDKLCKIRNGNKKRITAGFVNLVKM